MGSEERYGTKCEPLDDMNTIYYNAVLTDKCALSGYYIYST
jgi:hypothetical protein